MTTVTDHPARTAGLASQAAVRARDKQAWLALFAPDAVVEDPIGPSGFDPEGKGHHGTEAIAAFWDKAIAPTESIEFLFGDSFACGNEVAFTGLIRSRLGGHVIDAEGVFTYRVDAAGKLAALRAYWEVDRAMRTARPAQ
ncbi:nuclear transport factor 2 family protein [Nocardia farcinica]|uniref:Steroid Delta-isomerase n=1 Tax=Nocardia farcinica TaxID=37329 RepID=A0A449H713_NOCFR|nr:MULTISPECIES: nuclear transport factor 2 family protein [Nocardia]MBF6070309.1 nuclear transport factor 2 family protein [Nocardia farcinica]MBF6187214.1 nuclear transport factor 2 family protein [Nocardia farcinica]MBF6233701.1 nuclear transport factor 2 family protein [Nocardia farcinica]MBF6257952.1 nuclear transport factor 2 family protein [Nocardia farcinica]MBF6312863.1 nuclear transport factor 2 family protein [Nocardia farcinica]